MRVMPINWTGGKKHLPTRAKQNALRPIPLTLQMRKQRNILYKWNRRKRSGDGNHEMDKRSNVNKHPSTFFLYNPPQTTDVVQQDHLDRMRANILAKPSWIKPLKIQQLANVKKEEIDSDDHGSVEFSSAFRSSNTNSVKLERSTEEILLPSKISSDGTILCVTSAGVHSHKSSITTNRIKKAQIAGTDSSSDTISEESKDTLSSQSSSSESSSRSLPHTI